MRWAVLSAVVSCVAAGIYPTGFENVTWDDHNWRLQTTFLDPGHYQARANLANGYIGINLAALGPFFDIEKPVDGDGIAGWPLFNRRQSFATVSGFWDEQPTTNGTNYIWLNQNGGESVISGLPHWAGLLIESNGHVLNATTDPSQITGFSSTFDYGAALLSWRYTWTPPSAPALDVEYSTFIHKLHINQAAVRLKLTSSRDTNVTVADVLDGQCAVRSIAVGTGMEKNSSTIWSALQPNNIPSVTAYVYSTLKVDSCTHSASKMVNPAAFGASNASSIAQQVTVQLEASNTAVLEKYIGVASSDAFSDPRNVARNASLNGANQGFVAMLKTHISEWNALMPQDSVDDYRLPNGLIPDSEYAVEHQVISVTNPFYILQNTVGQRAVAAAGGNTKLHQNSVSVGGLSSDSYAGQVFWDADVWMAPGLVVAFPEAAQQISDYRISKYPQAMKNTQGNYLSSQADKHFSDQGAIYSWTSARFGNCTGTGPCFDYEYHINGDIGLQFQNQLIVTGNKSDFRDRMFPILNSIAETFSTLLEYNSTYKAWTLQNATDPDEFANNVDNPAFTMVLIKTHLNRTNTFRSEFGMAPVDLWSQQSNGILIPIDEKADIILEYTGMNGLIEVKQADVVLIDHFLDYQNPYTLSDLDFYAGQQSLDGPGMTFGVFSIVASHASPSGCSAFTYDVYGSQPYARAPWFQYSEQLVDAFSVTGFHPAFPFLTGMGGANQVAISGYLGLRLRTDSLNIDPSLPPQVTHLKYRTFFWQGHAISATSNTTHTTLSRLPASRALASANPAYAHAAIPVSIGYTHTSYQLPPSPAKLVIPNRQPALNLTVPHNAAQCKRATSADEYMPGQFPFAAVDGAVSTAWQPATAQPASLVVDLGAAAAGTRVKGLAFDWAQAPCRNVSVAFSNKTSAAPLTTAHGDQGWTYALREHAVSVSDPFDAAAAAQVTPYKSNSTALTFGANGTRAGVWAGRYALLTVRGSWANANDSVSQAGCSVAEWAVVGFGAGESAGGKTVRHVQMNRYHGE